MRRKIFSVLLSSVILLAVISVAAMIYGRITLGFFTFRFLFPAHFLTGAIIIMLGLVVMIIPLRMTAYFNLRDNKLIDHTNYALLMMEKKEKKRILANEFIYLGMSIIAISAIAQFLLSLII